MAARTAESSAFWMSHLRNMDCAVAAPAFGAANRWRLVLSVPTISVRRTSSIANRPERLQTSHGSPVAQTGQMRAACIDKELSICRQKEIEELHRQKMLELAARKERERQQEEKRLQQEEEVKKKENKQPSPAALPLRPSTTNILFCQCTTTTVTEWQNVSNVVR